MSHPRTHTYSNRQNNPGSNYRPGCCKTLPPFPRRTPRLKGRKTRLCRLVGGPTNPSGANLDKNHDDDGKTTTLRTTRLRFSGIGLHPPIHPPSSARFLRAISTQGLCVRERGGGERKRERERSSTPARFPPPGIDPRASFSAEGDEKAASNPASQGA